MGINGLFKIARESVGVVEEMVVVVVGVVEGLVVVVVVVGVVYELVVVVGVVEGLVVVGVVRDLVVDRVVVIMAVLVMRMLEVVFVVKEVGVVGGVRKVEEREMGVRGEGGREVEERGV